MGEPIMADDKTFTEEELNAAVSKVKEDMEADFKNRLQAETDRRVTQAVEKRDNDWKGKLETEKAEKEKAVQELGTLKEQAESVKRELTFSQKAVKEGMVDPEGGFAIARDRGYIKEDGEVDFDTLKKDRPYLFSQNSNEPSTPRGMTGAGNRTEPTDKGPTGDKKMNKLIRSAAGLE